MRRFTSLALLAGAVAGGLLAASVQTASAAPSGKGAPAPLAHRTPHSSKLPGIAPMSALAGYRQVSSATFTDPANSQVVGTVACPANSVVVGGGAVITSSSLSEDLNASAPLTDGVTWRAYVNNSGATSGTFRVYAVCVKKVAKYAVVAGTAVTNNAGTQTSASVTCPKGTVPLGGGGFASSGSTAVAINTSIPLAKGWRVDVNNGSTGTNMATAYAVCGKKPAGYAQVAGTPTTIGAGVQAAASAVCPSGTLVLGGGGFSSSGSTATNLNTTIPSSTTGWESFENNGTTSSNTLTAYAVCGTAH